MLWRLSGAPLTAQGVSFAKPKLPLEVLEPRRLEVEKESIKTRHIDIAAGTCSTGSLRGTAGKPTGGLK